MPETLQSCKDAFLELATEAPDWTPPATLQVSPSSEKSEAGDTESKQSRGERGATLLFNNLVLDTNFRLVRNNSGERFAVIEDELLNLQGPDFKDYLCYQYPEIARQPLKKDALNTVIMALSAKAKYEGELVQTPLRVGRVGNKIYLDLGRTKEGGRVVEIDPDKGDWNILDGSPILFRRGSWQKPIPTPVKGGDPWKFFDFCNISEFNRLIVLVTVITALVPGISHPALQLHGMQGSGKSFLAKMIKMLIDPAAALTLALPPREEDILLSFYRHYIAPIDNVTRLSTYLCEVICSFISGGYIEKRTLHTTMDVSTIPIDCIPIFTTINSAIHERPDLTERTIKIELPPINKQQRMRESVLLENFQRAIPEILGSMLTVLVKATHLYPSVELHELPRMSDWCVWAYAVAEALGGFGEQFLKDYFDNIGMQTTDMLDDNSLLSAISGRLENQGYLSGTFKEILNLLREDAQPALNDKSFPASPRSLRRHLERIRVPLSDLGIVYAIKGKTSRGRIIEFSKTGSAPEEIADNEPEASLPKGGGDLPF